MKIESKLISRKLLLTLLAALGMASAAFAQGESASGTVFGVPDSGSYDYTITLNNTSASVSIGSFWYAWVPGFFYLPGTPTSATAPVGWNAGIALNSIQFYANPGVFLTPGQSIQFQYVATFTPAQLTGLAGHSYVYSGGIEGDLGAFINVPTVPAPEPSSLSLLTAGFLGLVFAGRRKLRKLIVAS